MKNSDAALGLGSGMCFPKGLLEVQLLTQLEGISYIKGIRDWGRGNFPLPDRMSKYLAW